MKNDTNFRHFYFDLFYFSIPEKVELYLDGPACKVDVVALLTQSDAWWSSKKKFRMLSEELLPDSGLIERE